MLMFGYIPPGVNNNYWFPKNYDHYTVAFFDWRKGSLCHRYALYNKLLPSHHVMKILIVIRYLSMQTLLTIDGMYGL